MGAKLHGYEVDRPVRAGYLGDEKGGMKMERFWGDSNMVIKQKENTQLVKYWRRVEWLMEKALN